MILVLSLSLAINFANAADTGATLDPALLETEVVRDGIDGALVPRPDADAFEQAVLRVEGHLPDREALRRRAREFDRPLFEEAMRAVVAEAHARGRVVPA